MNFLYNIGIAAYRAAVHMVSSHNKKAKLMLEGQSRTCDYLKKHIDPRYR